MDGLEELEALVPFADPLLVAGGDSLFRQEVVDRGASEGVACAAGAGSVVSEAARIRLHPLNQLVHGLGRGRNLLGVVGKDNGGAAVRLSVILRDRALRLNRCSVRDLGLVELYEGLLADLGHDLCQVVAAPVNDVIIGVGLACLAGSCYHVCEALCAGTGEHELQLNLILVLVFGVGVEILGQLLEDGADVVRTGCPQSNGGLAAGSGVAAVAVLRRTAAAAGEGCRHHCCCKEDRT